MLKYKKILIPCVIFALIVIGIGLFTVKELNYDLIYSKSVRLTIYIEKEFTNNDLKEVVKEVLGDQKIYIQRTTGSENVVAITAREMSDEQADSIIQKLNVKYGIEINKELYTYSVEDGKVRGRDIVYPYAQQILIAVAVVTIYLCVMYKKVGIIKVLAITGSSLAITQLLYLSLLAIIKIPINTMTMPISILIFLTTVLGVTTALEKAKQDK